MERKPCKAMQENIHVGFEVWQTVEGLSLKQLPLNVGSTPHKCGSACWLTELPEGLVDGCVCDVTIYIFELP